jgi:hypothetical protein
MIGILFRNVRHLPNTKHAFGLCCTTTSAMRTTNMNHLTCGICQANVTDVGTLLRGCGDAFHPDCLTGWLAFRRTCPVCERDIITEPPASGCSHAHRFTSDELAQARSTNMRLILHQRLTADQALANDATRISFSGNGSRTPDATDTPDTTTEHIRNLIKIAYSKCVVYAVSDTRTPAELNNFQEELQAKLQQQLQQL